MRRRVALAHLDCRHVGAWLQSFLDGELDAVRGDAVDRHLRACRRCGMEAQTYRELKAAVQRNGQPAVPAESLRRLRTFAEQLAVGAIDPDQHPQRRW